MTEERQPPRRRRLSDAETAERMLNTAVQQLERDGITVSFDDISMEKVIAEAGVSRASAYRRWPHRQAFLTDVLVAAVTRTRTLPETDEDVAALTALLEDRSSDLHSEQGRRDLVVEGLRIASDFDIRRLYASVRWRNHLALAATHRGLPDGELKQSVGLALAQAEEDLLAHRAEIYAYLPALLGYRLVPPLEGEEGFRIMSSAAGAMMSGLLLRVHADPSWLDERRAMRPFGTSRESLWSTPELHLTGTFLSHLEPDPTQVWDDERVAASLRIFAERASVAAALRASQQDTSS